MLTGLILALTPNAKSGPGCRIRNFQTPTCENLENSHYRNYDDILGETFKNSSPEEYLTLVDKKGIRTVPYQETSGDFATYKSDPVRIDPSLTYQTMYGFGGSVTESCLENLKRLSLSERATFFEKIFDRKQGAGFSYLRIPIGANDFSKGDYTLNDTPGNAPDPELKLFSGQKLQPFIEFIQEAKKYNPNIKIVISPWTAPAWMKDTGKLRGGQIKKEYQAAYADYLLKTVRELENKGIRVDQMTFLNEPLIGEAKEKWDFPQAYMPPEDQKIFIQRYLSPKLAHTNTSLLLHDHNWDNGGYVDSMLKSNERSPSIEGVAYHCYGGSFSNLKKNIERKPDVPVFNTECSSTFNNGDAETMDWWQETQSLDAVKAGVSGSLGWNLCLDEKGGPQNNGCKTCRGLVTIDSRNQKMMFNPEFKALAATSKVIDAGSVRIQSTDPTPDVTSIAFKNPNGSFSLVLKNKSKMAQSYSISLGKCFVKTYHIPAGATLSTRWFQR